METSRELDQSMREWKAPEEGTEQEKGWNFKDRVKKAVLKTAAFSVIFGGHIAGYAQTRTSETRARFAPAAAEKVENKEGERKSFTIEQIRSGLRTDQSERILIATDKDPENQMHEISGAGISSGVIDYEKINKHIDERPGTTKLQLAHTHPWVAYRNIFANAGVTKRDQQEMRSGAKELMPHPPSMSDYQSQRSMETKYAPRGIKIESIVIDDGGTWTYSIEKDSAVMNELQTAQTEAIAERDKLSADQQKILDDIARAGTVDLRMAGPYLMNLSAEEDPTGEKRKLGRTLESIGERIEKKYEATLKIYDQVEDKGAMVVLAKNAEEKNTAIREYIEFCRKLGINVNYQPKQEK